MSIEVSYKLFCLATGHVAGGRPERHRGGRRDRNCRRCVDIQEPRRGREDCRANRARLRPRYEEDAHGAGGGREDEGDRDPEAPCRNWASRMDRIKPTRPKAALPHSQQEIGSCPLLPATARGIRQVCRMPRAVRTRERLSPYGTFVAIRKPVASGCQQMPKPSGFRGWIAKAIPPFSWSPANPKQNTSLRASGCDKRSSTRGYIKRSRREGKERARRYLGPFIQGCSSFRCLSSSRLFVNHHQVLSDLSTKVFRVSPRATGPSLPSCFPARANPRRCSSRP